MSEPKIESADTLAVTAEIVAAFVLKNRVLAGDLPRLIQSVHATVAQLGGETAILTPLAQPAASTESIRKSITPDYLICFEDGRRFKSMRRHLTFLGMSPDEYRAKWKLPADYPMVAANYSARRSELAKRGRLADLGISARIRKSDQPSSATVETVDL